MMPVSRLLLSLPRSFRRNAETRMQAGDTEMRFGRCPYCRAMIRQNPSAAVYYCSKCRTPIRGKNTEPAGEATDDALSRLEILSADGTASVFSDDPDASSSTQASVIDVDGDQPPFSSGYNSCSNSDAAPNIHDNTAVAVPSPSKNGEQQDEGGSVNHHVNELRPSSRRTRRASSASDSGVLRRGDFSVSKELGTSVSMSGVGLEASNVGVATSPLTDPAFHRDLLRLLDKLRGMVAAIELQPQPASKRCESRFFRRMESRLSQQAEHGAPRRGNNASAGSSWSSFNGNGERPAARLRKKHKHHCLPVFGGAPFAVCGECSELLRVPALARVPLRRRVARLRCGGCEGVLELALPAAAGAVAGHAQADRRSGARSATTASGSSHGSGDLQREADRSGGAQQVPALLLLHHALGYDSPSPLLQSRRY
ncbi:uncharacterized protein LOC112270625 isoform X1 [Brachypodium distachyon]|nr:uncharacterized protein LOC112270625 isoform X1 [Brachypodium distachyon]|eukprot:XP_024314227.1 uncharacterized protein LOC112270625 isoform X1 [Brachypodium distachyon]